MEEFTPLRISTIKAKKSLTFDLFIFFKEQYLCYAQNGRELEQSQLDKLRKQKIARFFIHAEDEGKYQQFLDEILKEALDNPDVSVEEKTEVAEGAAESAMERMQSNPESRSAYQMTELAANGLRKVITENPEALKIIFEKEGADDTTLIKHSLNVAVLATKLAETEGLEEGTLDNIATAALIHDIGITKLNDEMQQLFENPRDTFTPDQKREFYTHPQVGVDLFKEKDYINDNILELILNHEENVQGSGPQKKMKLTREEEIISLVDVFDIMVTCNKMTPSEAMKQLQIDQMGNFDLELMNKFKKVAKEQGLT